MKRFCLKIGLSIVLLACLNSLTIHQAQAKAPYGATWTIGGNSLTIEVKKTTIDSADNVYYAGSVIPNGNPVAFNPIDGVSDVKTATGDAIFLTKINTDGTYGYTYLYDGAASIILKQIKTDSDGNVYILGSFSGLVNFDPVGSTDIIDSGTDTWGFLTKIDSLGAYKYTRTWQNPNIDIKDMSIDAGNNVYIAGSASATDSANLDPVGSSDIKTVNTGETMLFYLKINAGGTYGYSRSLKNTGSNNFELDNIDTDTNSNVYLYGVFFGTPNFNGQGGSDTQDSNGFNALYLSKYDSAGNYLQTYVWAGSDNQSAETMGIDRSNNVYIAGGFNGTLNFDPIATSDAKTSIVSDQRFLTKINSDNTYGYTKVWNNNSLSINKIAFDSGNAIYLMGNSSGVVNYEPLGIGDDIITGFGLNDFFITFLNSDGTYSYTYVLGGAADEAALDGSIDNFNNLYIGGYTDSPSINFDPTGGNDTKTLKGTFDGFVTKILTSQTIPPGPPGTPPTFGEPKNDFTCTSPWPSAPVLYQISATGGKATLYFVPPAESQDGYTISYGSSSDADMYNVTFPFNDKSGAISYTINYLSTNVTYYFKVRANNGCMPGLWSKILSAKAPSVGTFTSYYSATNSFNGASAASGTNGQCTQYTVLPGDSLWAIAQKLLANGRRYLELWNGNTGNYPSLKNSSTIRAGWKLNVGC